MLGFYLPPFLLCFKSGGGAEGEGKRVPSRLHTEHRAHVEAQSHDPEIRTPTKTKSGMLNRMRHPAPHQCIVLNGG